MISQLSRSIAKAIARLAMRRYIGDIDKNKPLSSKTAQLSVEAVFGSLTALLSVLLWALLGLLTATFLAGVLQGNRVWFVIFGVLLVLYIPLRITSKIVGHIKELTIQWVTDAIAQVLSDSNISIDNQAGAVLNRLDQISGAGDRP